MGPFRLVFIPHYFLYGKTKKLNPPITTMRTVPMTMNIVLSVPKLSLSS
jgi:hypothetical protein